MLERLPVPGCEYGIVVFVAIGFELADPTVGLAITLVILKITWDSWRTVRGTEPGEPAHED